MSQPLEHVSENAPPNINDRVEWWNFDRRGTRHFHGVVIGEATKRNTHLRARTEKGIREVHRFRLRKATTHE